jgi:hypothetical protein
VDEERRHTLRLDKCRAVACCAGPIPRRTHLANCFIKVGRLFGFRPRCVVC